VRQEGNGDGNKDDGQVNCKGKEEGDGDGNKGGRQAMVTATKKVMATVRRVVGRQRGQC
jgi:hypothetical protein